MEKTPTPISRRILPLLLIGIPYTIFYYPVDIYGLQPAAVFLLLLGCYSILLYISQNRARGQWRTTAGAGVRALAFLRAAVVLSLAVILLNFGSHGWEFGHLLSYLIQFCIKPFFYAGILWSLSVTFFAISALAGVTLAVWLRRVRFRIPAAAFWGFWLFICLALAHFTLFKMGPMKSSCRGIADMPGVNLLLSRNTIDALPGLRGALPYDAVVDAPRGLLFVSLKQTHKEPGGLARIRIRDGRVQASLITDLNNRRPIAVNEFPERMSINPERREVYALVLSPGNSHLLIASYEGRGLQPLSYIRLLAEPNYVFADVARGRIFVFYAGAGRNGYAIYDADTRRLIGEVSDKKLNGSAQHMTANPDTGLLYLTLLGANKIVEIDPANRDALRAHAQMDPVEGIALDPVNNRLFAPGPFSRKLQIFETRGFKRAGSRRVRCGLADAAFDPVSRMVTVGGYTGTVDIFSTAPPWRVVKRLKLPHLLRNVTPDRRGTVYACSGCGVFAIDPGKYSHKNARAH